MSDRPTPETDAAAGNILDANEEWAQTFDQCESGTYVPADFARKLERERDELRETLEEWRCHNEAWGTQPHQVRKHIAAITKERDALRAENDKLISDSAMLDFILKNVNGTREQLAKSMKGEE